MCKERDKKKEVYTVFIRVKNTRGKEKVVRNRKQREAAPGHSQKIEAR